MPNQPIISSTNQMIRKRLSLKHFFSLLLILFTVFIGTSALADSETETRGEFLGAMETVYPDWFKVSFMELEDDVAEAAAEGKRLMLLFHQDGCPYCNAFVERNLAQKDIEQKLKSEFDVVEFNMWGDREVVSVDGEVFTEKAFAKALGVQFTPTVIFLTEEGKLSLRLNGYYAPDRFRSALDYVSNKMETQISFGDFLATNAQPSSSKTLIERDYFSGPITQLSERSKNANKPLILLFEQGGCRNCETLHDKILSKPESQTLLEAFDLFQIDMWSHESITTLEGTESTGRQWSGDLGVNYAPTMILYAADGTEVIRSEAFFKSFHVQSILDYVSSEAWQEEPSFQRYISARAEKMRESGVDVNIWD